MSDVEVPNIGYTTFIPAVVFLVVTPIIIALRIWARLSINTKLGADDWTILVAAASSVAMSVVLIIAVHFGYGKHGADITPAYEKTLALKYFVASQYTYKISINLTKASILFLYLRLFVQKPFRIACWVLMGFVAAYGVATTLASIFQCTPIQKSWDKSIPYGSCIDTTSFWFANASLSIAGDFILMVLPMPVIYALKLRTNQKISLMLVFCLGSFVIVTSILRMTALDTTSKTPDPTWGIGATMWTTLEANIAIICACLPMLRMPLARLFPALFPSTTNSRTGNTNVYANGGFSKAGTGKNDWTPSQSNHTNKDIHLTSVAAGRETGSEEYILAERDERFLGAVGKSGQITKTTQFSVKYDDDVSMDSGERSPNRKIEHGLA